MENDETRGKGSRGFGNWLTVLGGCGLAITVLCALVLAVLLMASTAFNVYLAWTLSGYEVSVGRPTSASTALVLVTPTGVLAVIPTPTTVPTSTQPPTATMAPTSTSTLIPAEATTAVRSSTANRTMPKPKPTSPAATATPMVSAEQGGSGTNGAGTSEGSSMTASTDTSPSAGQPTPEAITYVVQQGDTLWLIANKAYGAGSMWTVIFEANRDVLDVPDQIRPEQVLRIPLNP